MAAESPVVASASPDMASARLVLPATPATLQVPTCPVAAESPVVPSAIPVVGSMPEVANVEIKLASCSNCACREKK